MSQNTFPTNDTDPGEPSETDRPTDCRCSRTRGETLPCFPCHAAGFKTPAPRVGDIVKADWSKGNGSYDEIIGEITEIHDNGERKLLIVDVDADHPACKGGDELRGGSHDCAPEWIQKLIHRPVQ